MHKQTRKEPASIPYHTTQDEEATQQKDSKTNVILDFFRIVERSVHNHSVEKVVTTLRKLDIQSALENKNHEILVEYIIEAVLQEFASDEVKRKQLFEKTERGEVTVARKLCMILMKEFTKMSNAKIGMYFGGRSRQIVFNVAKEYEEKDHMHRSDLSFLNRYTRLSKKVEYFMHTTLGKIE